MSWFDKLMPSRIKTEQRKRSVPEGLWVKCSNCAAQLYRAELKRNLFVCPKCEHHMRVGARDRLEMFLDPDSSHEIAAKLEPQDPLKFRDSKRYRDRLSQAQKATGESDAMVVFAGTVKAIPVVAAEDVPRGGYLTRLQAAAGLLARKAMVAVLGEGEEGEAPSAAVNAGG